MEDIINSQYSVVEMGVKLKNLNPVVNISWIVFDDEEKAKVCMDSFECYCNECKCRVRWTSKDGNFYWRTLSYSISHKK